MEKRFAIDTNENREYLKGLSEELLDTVWPGKSDLYHAFQATLIPYNEVSISIATAVSINNDNHEEV